jgi:hypothetical protein
MPQSDKSHIHKLAPSPKPSGGRDASLFLVDMAKTEVMKMANQKVPQTYNRKDSSLKLGDIILSGTGAKNESILSICTASSA